MTDLVEFLRARLDEDEQIARYSGEPGRWDIGECVSTNEPGRTEWEIVTEDGSVTARTATNMRAAHIARHDPARALREVERDRRIIEASGVAQVCADERPFPHAAAADFADGVLRLLALPYADHPDYQQEWNLNLA